MDLKELAKAYGADPASLESEIHEYLSMLQSTAKDGFIMVGAWKIIIRGAIKSLYNKEV